MIYFLMIEGQLPGYRSIHQRCSIENSIFKNFTVFTGKHLCQSLFLFLNSCRSQACNFIKETLAQVFSCGFSEIFKNTFFTEHPWTTASKDTSLKTLNINRSNQLNSKSRLILSCRRSLSYRNQSTDLLCKSMDWFLYDRELHHERVKEYV